MKRCFSLVLLMGLFTTGKVLAQDTLPNFTVTDRGDKVTISWSNPFQNVIQLSVQRSFDSIRNFTSVFSAPSPQLPQNGFTETKMPTNRIFYRIFYVLEGGSYFFTDAKRVGAPSAPATSMRDIRNGKLLNVNATDQRKVTIRIRDQVYRQIPAFTFKNFRDSILRQTKDTMFAINDSLVVIRPFVAVESWRPSMYIFSNKDGYISIVLPLIHQKKYHVKFFEDDGTFVFEIPHIRDSPLILDKANFIHAGWFHFELYEDDKLKEKNKFYLSKDF